MKNSEKNAYPHPDIYPDDFGFTKRERFAMAAMQGLCANGAADSLYPHQISDLSIEIADSLLTKLEGTQ